jgi:cyclase
MIGAADKILSLADNETKIVAGHSPLGNKVSPLGNKADLAKFRDMLVTSRDRIGKLKSAGKYAQEAVTEKPFADLDSVWGKGMLSAEQFVQIVYLTL